MAVFAVKFSFKFVCETDIKPFKNDIYWAEGNFCFFTLENVAEFVYSFVSRILSIF